MHLLMTSILKPSTETGDCNLTTHSVVTGYNFKVLHSLSPPLLPGQRSTFLTPMEQEIFGNDYNRLSDETHPRETTKNPA
jgi:hypothetical protein